MLGCVPFPHFPAAPGRAACGPSVWLRGSPPARPLPALRGARRRAVGGRFSPGPGLVLSPRAGALPVFLARLRMPISFSLLSPTPFFYRVRLRFLVSSPAFSGFCPPGWGTGSRCGAPANISRTFRFRLPFSPCSVPRVHSRHFSPFSFRGLTSTFSFHGLASTPFRSAVLFAL